MNPLFITTHVTSLPLFGPVAHIYSVNITSHTFSQINGQYQMTARVWNDFCRGAAHSKTILHTDGPDLQRLNCECYLSSL